MSSSVVAESSGSQKTENTVIIFVNNDGSLSVDEQTLQKLLVSNQQKAAVSLVRVGDTEGKDEAQSCDEAQEEPTADSSGTDSQQPEVNLTVEGFFPQSNTEVSADPVVVGTDNLVDPFLEMDPEQLERLETALQSEQAKQILGEGVTAMLDMLTSEDDQTTTLKNSIRMDHCYTTSCGRASPAGDKPGDEGEEDAAAEKSDTEDGEDEEEETESEEELDSEEEAKRKRSGGRGRGRNRGGNVRGRGAQAARGGKTRVRAAVKRIAPTTPSNVKTTTPAAKATPAAKPAPATKSTTPTAKSVATRGGLTLQQQQHLQQMQQLKALPVVALSSTSVQKHVLQSAQIQSLLRNTQASTAQAAAEPVAQPPKQPEVVKDPEEETEKKQDAVTPVKVEKSRTRTTSQSGATPLSPTTKGKKKPPAAAQKPQRASTESATPVKEEQTSPQTRRTSMSSEESSGKKAPEITSPAEVTPEAQGRKMYPKRENRKPPAHLAEAFGPALFSTPDIPRRISDAKSSDVKHEVKSEADGKSDVAMLELPAELLVENPAGEAESDSKVMLVPELQAVLGEIGPELLEQMQEEALVMDTHEEEEEQQPKSEPVTSTPKGKATGANPKRNRNSSAKVRAQESAANQAKPSGSGRDNKRGRGLSKVTAAAIKELQAPSDEDEREEGEEEDEESWNSEDDPDRLWCICRKPHNNRFMICCDRCEEWFHGACVGITKSLGKQMESRGEEWTCPECAKIKLQEQQAEKAKVLAAKKEQTMATKSAANRRSSTNSAGAAESSQTAVQRRKSVSEEKVKSAPQASKPQAKPAATVKNEDGVMCIVCRKAPARSASVYCSQECILKHAEEATNLIDKAAATKIADAKAAVPTVVASTSVASPKVATTIQQARVMLLERKTGKLLTGTNAPTLANLNVWLQKHPTYEVVTPGLLTTARAQGKEPGTIVLKTTPGSKQTTLKLVATPIKLPDTPNTAGAKTPATPTSAKTTLLVPAQRLPTPATKTATPTKIAPAPKATPPSPTKAVAPKSVAKQGASKAAGSKAAAAAPATAPAPVEKVDKADEEPRIRISVRKTLKELLQSRVQECDDLKVSDNEVTGIASNIEEELHALFKDTGAKYKAKYRSLVFNIKDPKNLALFHKIVSGEVAPHRLVRLSPEELATKELAQWREREAQHTLDMIKKNEMEMMSQSITYVMKTHKGEQLIETDDSLKLQALAVEAESGALEPESSAAEGDTGFESSLTSSEKLSSSATTEKPSKSSTASSSSKKSSHHHNSKSSSSSRSSRHDKKHSRHSSSTKHSSSSSRSKSHKSSKEKSSSRDTKDKERHHSQSSHRHSTDSHSGSSKSRKHSEQSEVSNSHTEKEKSSSRSSSSLSKSSGTHRSHKSSSTKDSSTPPQVTVPDPEPVKPLKVEKPPDPTPDLLATVPEPATPPTEDADLSDREPSSTVTIKTPDSIAEDAANLPLWRGSFFGADITKFAVTAHEVSGNVSGLQQELSGALEIVGRISPPIAWDYFSKMKKSGTKEIVVVRLNPATLEDKVGYLSYYSYLSNRVRFGVVGLKASAVKDYYVMPLSSHAPIPQILLPLDGPGFEESRPHLLLGIVVRMRRKRPSDVAGLPSAPVRSKEARSSATERSYTPPLPEPRERGTYTPPLPPKPPQEDLMPYSPGEPSSGTPSPPSDEASEQKTIYSSELEELNRKIEEEKQQIQQKMQTISSELVSTNSQDDLQVRSLLQQITQTQALLATSVPGLTQLIVQTDVTTEELTTQVSTSQSVDDENEAYSPSRSFTPPPVSEESKASSFSLPDTSNISLPSNLQEILASIQRKGSSGTTVISESSSTTAVLSLETDPIVRDYASADEPAESSTPPLPDAEQDVDMRGTAPPVQERLRDPRKPPEPAKKSLSKLTEDELLAMAQAQEIAEAVPAVPIVPVVPTIPPPPLPPVMFYPPPVVPMADVSPPGVLPVVLPPMETSQSTSKDTEPPRKGISFKVEKRQQQPRWCRSTDNKNSPKRSASSPPPDSPPRRRHHKDSD